MRDVRAETDLLEARARLLEVPKRRLVLAEHVVDDSEVQERGADSLDVLVPPVDREDVLEHVQRFGVITVVERERPEVELLHDRLEPDLLGQFHAPPMVAARAAHDHLRRSRRHRARCSRPSRPRSSRPRPQPGSPRSARLVALGEVPQDPGEPCRAAQRLRPGRRSACRPAAPSARSIRATPSFGRAANPPVAPDASGKAQLELGAAPLRRMRRAPPGHCRSQDRAWRAPAHDFAPRPRSSRPAPRDTAAIASAVEGCSSPSSSRAYSRIVSSIPKRGSPSTSSRRIRWSSTSAVKRVEFGAAHVLRRFERRARREDREPGEHASCTLGRGGRRSTRWSPGASAVAQGGHAGRP